jgi:hypothetical protein
MFGLLGIMLLFTFFACSDSLRDGKAGKVRFENQFVEINGESIHCSGAWVEGLKCGSWIYRNLNGIVLAEFKYSGCNNKELPLQNYAATYFSELGGELYTEYVSSGMLDSISFPFVNPRSTTIVGDKEFEDYAKSWNPGGDYW